MEAIASRLEAIATNNKKLLVTNSGVCKVISCSLANVNTFKRFVCLQIVPQAGEYGPEAGEPTWEAEQFRSCTTPEREQGTGKSNKYCDEALLAFQKR